jgi:hypothetical protein
MKRSREDGQNEGSDNPSPIPLQDPKMRKLDEQSSNDVSPSITTENAQQSPQTEERNVHPAEQHQVQVHVQPQSEENVTETQTNVVTPQGAQSQQIPTQTNTMQTRYPFIRKPPFECEFYDTKHHFYSWHLHFTDTYCMKRILS